MVASYEFYTQTYLGKEVTAEEFPAVEAKAEDVIGAMAHWKVTEVTIGNLPSLTQTLYKKAICAQADFFAVNGLDVVAVPGPSAVISALSISGMDCGFHTGRLCAVCGDGPENGI